MTPLPHKHYLAYYSAATPFDGVPTGFVLAKFDDCVLSAHLQSGESRKGLHKLTREKTHLLAIEPPV